MSYSSAFWVTRLLSGGFSVLCVSVSLYLLRRIYRCVRVCVYVCVSYHSGMADGSEYVNGNEVISVAMSIHPQWFVGANYIVVVVVVVVVAGCC